MNPIVIICGVVVFTVTLCYLMDSFLEKEYKQWCEDNNIEYKEWL